MTAAPEITVVMATYNGDAHLAEQLASIRHQETTRSWELVIADNGSTDRSVEVARAAIDGMPNARIIDAREERGQSYARTAGAAAGSGRYLLFVDQDDRLDPDYLEEMARALDDAPLVAARMDCDTLNPGWARGARTPAQVRSLGDGLGFLPYAAGCTIGTHRSAFEQVGGFDSTMIGAAEDVDLCWRIQLAVPCSIVFVPDAVVAYRFRDSLRSLARQAKGHGIAQAQLLRRYRRAGMAPPSWRRIGTRFLVAVRAVLREPGRASLANVEWQAVHTFWFAASLVRRRP